MLTGCAQPVLEPGINEAAIALMTRLGIEVVVPEGEGCCGALVHHMGREEQALASARRNIDAWTREIDEGGLDAIVITASGCGTTIKDYGFMLRLDPAYAAKAARVSGARQGRQRVSGDARPAAAVAEAGHGRRLPLGVLDAARPEDHAAAEGAPGGAGFSVKEPREGHLCCGSAGTYNLLQPAISERLRDRKVNNIEAPVPRSSRPAISAASSRSPRQRNSGGAHGGTAGLGLWRQAAGRALSCGRRALVLSCNQSCWRSSKNRRTAGSRSSPIARS